MALEPVVTCFDSAVVCDEASEPALSSVGPDPFDPE